MELADIVDENWRFLLLAFILSEIIISISFFKPIYQPKKFAEEKAQQCEAQRAAEAEQARIAELAAQKEKELAEQKKKELAAEKAKASEQQKNTEECNKNN